jgi:hypothetical protein
MATLRELRCLFTRELAALIDHATLLGYEAALGEVYRSPLAAKANAELGKGISNSLHIDGLAADLNLYRGGKYLDKTEDHQLLGEWWESRGPNHRWGGRFKDKHGRPKPDGNHYALSPDGKRA